MSKEAMKLAQKAIEAHNSGDWDAASELFDEALPALRKALANEALDRVSENARELGLDYGVEQDLRVFARVDAMRAKGLLKLTAALEQPAQQEPVAWAFLNGQYAHIVWGKQRPDDEIHTIPLYPSPQPCPTCEALVRTVMLDQTSHDAQRKPQQDPFIYYRHYDGGTQDFPDEKTIPLYTSPPAQRKPLTDEVTDRCIEAADTRWADAFVPIQWARHFKNAIEAAHGIKGDA